MATYKVLSNLKHDGVEYVAGDSLTDIKDDEARELVNERVIEPAAEVQHQQVAQGGVQAGTEQQGAVQL